MIFALVISAIVCGGLALSSLNDYEHGLAACWFVTAAVLGGLASVLSNTPEHVAARYAEQQADAAAARAAATPHVITESPDGCKVYKFRDEQRDHYFTSCPDSHTTTDSSHEERSGKTSSTIIESITSEVHP